MKKLVVVAPTYNEEQNIELFLKSVLEQQKNLKDIDLEVLVSDSHSSDKTAQIVEKLFSQNKKVHFLDVQKRGLGLGLIKGLDFAVDELKADLLITMEADRSADPKQFEEFLNKLKEADLVVGSRYMKGGKIENWTWWRKVISKIANTGLRLMALTLHLHEFTNLYRAFKKEVWITIRPKVQMHDDWIFVPAFIFETLGTKFKIVEQPMVLSDRFGGKSKMNTVSYTRNLLRYAISYRLHKSSKLIKFAIVGFTGFAINSIVLVLGVKFGLLPSIAGPLGGEAAIIVAFTINNLWTFSKNQIKSATEIPFKFLQYNIIALGSIVIQFICLKIGELIFGIARFKSPIFDFPIVRFYSWYMLFFMCGVGIGMIWNYLLFNKVVWKKKNENS